MEVTKELTIPLAAPAKLAWRFVQDMHTLIPCMAGAAISETIEDSTFKATLKVKIGPVTANFKGDIAIEERDADNYTMTISGKGGDVKGTSKASMKLNVAVVSTGAATSEITGKSVVTVTGKMASFGSRMMDDISDRLLKQFADNVTKLIESEAAGIEYQQPAKEMNALALVFDIIRGWFKGLFGAGKAAKS